MAASKIEWTDRTWNPTTGCDRTSTGCDHCYALRLAARLKAMGQEKYANDGNPRTSGPGFAFTEHPDTLGDPLRWTRPSIVFVNSMSDLFHAEASDLFIAKVFAVMGACPQHRFQILTKRSKGMAGLLTDDNGEFRYKVTMARRRHAPDAPVVALPLPNVDLGVSIENDRYTFRADHLRATPAACRFLSLEPLVGPVPSLDLTGIDWVIVGGESGPGARPMHPAWVRDVRDRCVEAGVPFFFKQWGDWALGASTREGRHRALVSRSGGYVPLDEDQQVRAMTLFGGDTVLMRRIGKKAAGRRLDGRTWDERPQPLDTPA